MATVSIAARGDHQRRATDTNNDIMVRWAPKRYIPGFSLRRSRWARKKTITPAGRHPQEDKQGKEAVFEIKVA